MAGKAKKRIGVHLGTTGGCWTAVNRAVEAGANTFQIFSLEPAAVAGGDGEAGGCGRRCGSCGRSMMLGRCRSMRAI